MSTQLDVTFRLDETLTINAILSDPNGAAADLTGMTGTSIQWGISDRKNGPTKATVSIGAGITIVSATLGQIIIRYEPTGQDPLHPSTRYFHECRMVHPSWGTSIQFAGKAHVLESIFETELAA